MTEAQDQNQIEVRKNAILLKVGRNVVNLQMLEAKLKVLQSFQISAPVKEFPAARKRRKETLARQTLGPLTHEAIDKLFPQESSQLDFDNLITEAWGSFSLMFKRDAGLEASMRTKLRKLVEDRNELIHHMFGGIDPRSAERCSKLDAQLDAQCAQIVEVSRWLDELIAGIRELIDKAQKSPGQLLHLELKEPVALNDWQAVLHGTDPETTFRSYEDTFGDGRAFRITAELKAVLDDFESATLGAVFAVRKNTIVGLWLDPLHNFIASEFSRAQGDEEDVVLIQSLTPS